MKLHIAEKELAKKMRRRSVGFTAVAAALLFFGACSLGPGFSGGSVSPEISLKGLSSDVSSVDVRVTGPDIDRSYTITPSTTSLAMSLPPAENVRFEVEAPNDNVGDGPVYSWGMARYADLVTGETTELDFMMGPKDTKIIIPDNSSHKIVQVSSLDVSENVDTLTADQWQVATTPINVSPNDTALDNQGRIWVSYNTADINMIENILAESSYTDGVSGSAIAFDRMNSYLYYISGSSTIGRFEVTADISEMGATETFDLGSESEITTISTFGIAVDQGGYLYFVGKDNQLEQTTIFKYDPRRNAGDRVVATYRNQDILPGTAGNMDLLVKNDHLYLTNPNDPTTGAAILKLTKSLQYADSFGRVVDWGSGETAEQKGEFYGPMRFLATTTDALYMTDEKYNSGDESPNRIIHFENLEGKNWKTYHPVSDDNDVLYLYDGGV